MESDGGEEESSEYDFKPLENRRDKMKRVLQSKNYRITGIAVGVTLAVVLLCGTVWAEKKDNSKINVQTGATVQQASAASAQAEPVNPFRDMLQLQREMEQVFDGRPSAWNAFSRDPSFQDDAFLQQPDMDVHEQADAYHVKVDLPGVDKSGITVEVKDNILTVSAENKQTSEKKEAGKVLMKERSEGYVSRSVMLPKSVDASNVTAEYKDGVLNITLPKVEKDQAPHRVEIQ